MSRSLSRSIFALAAILPSVAFADGTPLNITHAGRLLDSSDQPVTSNALSLSFRIANTEVPISTEVISWQGTCSADVLRGLYAVVLGAGECAGTTTLDTTDVPLSEARYLEVTVAGQKLLPRLKLNAAPLATLAGDSERLGGIAATQYVKTTDLGASGTAAIDGARMGSGTVAAARLPASVVLLDREAQVFTGSIEATSFKGLGANVTGVDAVKLEGRTLTELDGRYLRAGGTGGDLTLTGAFASGSLTTGAITATTITADALAGRSLAQLDGRYARTNVAGAVTFGIGAGAVTINNGGVRLGSAPLTCDGASVGLLGWSGTNAQVCTASGWAQLDNTSASAATISSVAPATTAQSGGTAITITGTNFVGVAQVLFGATPVVSFSVPSATQINAVAPAGAVGAANVTVVTSAGAVTKASAVTYGQTVFAYTGAQVTWNVPAGVTSIVVKSWGAGGGGTTNGNGDGRGGAGGYTQATVTVTPAEPLSLIVGGGGTAGGTNTSAFGGGGTSGGQANGGGGGYTGIFRGSPAQATALVVAGGGGGSGSYLNGAANAGFGGAGGGRVGLDAEGPQRSGNTPCYGLGGSQSAGGAGAVWSSTGETGVALRGGNWGSGSGSAGGGGGYWGGGAGAHYGGVQGCAGGGGSGFVATTGTANVVQLSGERTQPPNQFDEDYLLGVAVGGAGANGGNGLVVVSY